MSQLASNLAALDNGGAKSPRRRAQSPRRNQLKHGAEPIVPDQCYASGLYFRGATQVKSSVIPFLDGQITRQAHNRRAHCASFPRQNAWVDAVKDVTDRTGLSAAEAARLLKQTNAFPTGSVETRPSQTREYRKANRVQSPSRQQRNAPVASADLNRAVQQGMDIARRRGIQQGQQGQQSPRAASRAGSRNGSRQQSPIRLGQGARLQGGGFAQGGGLVQGASVFPEYGLNQGARQTALFDPVM